MSNVISVSHRSQQQSRLEEKLRSEAAEVARAPKAITATAHKLARIIYNLMRFGVAYMQRQEADYAEQVRARLEKQLQRRPKRGAGARTSPRKTPSSREGSSWGG